MLQGKDSFEYEANGIAHETAYFHIWRKAETAQQGKVNNEVP